MILFSPKRFRYLASKIDQKRRGAGSEKAVENCGGKEYWNKANSRALVFSIHFTKGDWERKLIILFNSVKQFKLSSSHFTEQSFDFYSL